MPQSQHQTDPTPLAFSPVEDCKSTLSLFIVLNREDRKEPINFWEASDACREVLPGHGKLVAHQTIPGIDIYGAEFDLAELPDEEALLNAIDPFVVGAKASLGWSARTDS